MGPGFESLKVHQTKPYPNFSGKALFFVSRRFELRSRRRGFFYACGHLSPARADFRHRRSLAVGSRLRETANSLKVHQNCPILSQKCLKSGFFLCLLGGSMYFHFSHTLPRATVFQFALIFQYQGISIIRTACKKNSADYLFADYLCQTI